MQPPVAPSFQVYAGRSIIPAALSAAGWSHVGDPDSRSGYVVYPYQAEQASQGKLYLVVTPDGHSYRYTHALAPGEEINNSFAAISPDGQWLVSGEWGVENRLLIFPMPILNSATSPTGGTLPLVGTINLGSPTRDLQGCTFVTSSRLLCASDDAEAAFQATSQPLLQVDLAGVISASNVAATVTSLGQLPLVSVCTGTFEVEGLDYDIASTSLRVVVIPPAPCLVTADVYEYRPTP